MKMKKNKIIKSAFLFSIALLLAGGMSFAQVTNMNTNSSQPGAGAPCPGATNVILYYFTLNVTSGSPSFTRILNFTTSGTYAAADIVNLKLYRTNFEVFNTTSLISTIAAGLGPGAHTFGVFANALVAAPSQRYFWVTADIAAGATPGRTITCDLITAAMITITGTLNYGTNNAAGTQTICGVPIELLSFTGKSLEEKNLLEWTTATEMNNDFFTIEKSEDGISYSELIRIKGAGNSSMNKNYSTTDDEPFPNLTYYRLKQTDFNDDFTYSSVISISDFPEVTISLTPNPTQNDMHLNFFSEKEILAQADIINSLGQCLMSKNIQLSKGAGFINFDVGILPRGIYLFKFGNSFFQKQIKFLKL